MQKFIDKNGEDWTVELNVGTARRVKADCNIDLINVITIGGDGKVKTTPLEILTDDPFALVNVLFSLCKEQAKERGLDDFAFASLFNAEAIETATNALMEELINFSQPAKRKALAKIYQMAKTFAAKNEEALDKILNSPELEKEIESRLNSSYTGTQESSE